MKTQFKLALSSAAIAALVACGGDGDTVAAVPAPATTNVVVTVMDGLVQGASACLDVNGNGACEPGEPQAATKTNEVGQASFTVLNTDLGKYPVLAEVPVGAVDADSGPVTTAYTMSAPADQTAVVSPLTTLVQQAVAASGATTADAVASVQSQSGLSSSPLSNYLASGDKTAALAARILVAALQSQTTALTAAVNRPDSSGGTISTADMKKAVKTNLSNFLAASVATGSDPAVVAACTVTTSATCKTAIDNAVTTLVADAGLTNTTLAAAVGLSKLVLAGTTSEPAGTTPTASFDLDVVNAGTPEYWYYRVFTSTAAEATPDANGLTRYRSIRHARVGSEDLIWAAGSTYERRDDLHWNGSAWTGCTVNTQATSTVRDAQGRSKITSCDNAYQSNLQRSTIDISGRAMTDVFALIQANRSQGSNWGKAPLWYPGTVTVSVDGASFPTNSKLYVQSDVETSNAIGYDVRSSNILTVSNAAVAAGGDTTADSTLACNANTSDTQAFTLETMIARNPGTACIFAPGTIVGAGGSTLASGPKNEGWGRTTTGLGRVGNAAVGSSIATSYYTGNTKFQVSFAGGSSNGVTFYACQERADNGAARNCLAIGTGTYSITTLDDARVMTLQGFPGQMAALDFERVFVERGGQVYWAYKEKLNTYLEMRLNGIAGNAVLAQLGIPTFTP